MADLATLERALRNADAAGDAAAARMLAAEIRKMQVAPPAAAQAENPLPPQEAKPQGQSSYGMLWPIRRDPDGSLNFDSDAGVLGSLKRSVMLPGEVMAGKVPLFGDDGYASPEIIARNTEFAANFSPATPGLRAGSGLVPGEQQFMQKIKPPAPSADDLYAAADDGFRAMRESGVDYASSAVKDVANALKTRLESEGFDAEVAGKTHSILNKLANPPEDSVASITGLHSARKTFGKIAQNFNDPTDQSAAVQSIRGLDDFIQNAGPEAVVAGTPADAGAALKSANANYAAASRSDLLTGIERAGDLRAAGANSGANTGNAIRQRVASALLKPKEIAGYSPEEVAALEKIVMGTKSQNATRYVGNLLGGGGGLGQAVVSGLGAAGGFAAGGSGGAAAAGAMIPAMVGAGSKAASNYLTRRALGGADEMVRMRSPLYQQAIDAAPSEAVRNMRLEAIIRALMSSPGGAMAMPRQLAPNET